MKRFVSDRNDGRSDRRVLYDLVHGAAPETVYTFDDLIAELQAGVDEEITTRRVYSAVAAVNRDLLAKDQRVLLSIIGTGYRVGSAADHLPAAMERKDRAESQIEHGLAILRNTRLDELGESQRQAHLGVLMVMSGIHEAVRVQEQRMERQARVIDNLVDRVNRLEGQA